MATIKDVARLAGVSVATVSHVINGTRPVSPETAAKVWKAIKELDYHPNAVARSLRTRVTHVIGVVVSDITNPFFATLVRGAEDAAIEAGYSLIVCNSDEDLGKEDLYVNMLRRRRMDGLLIAPVRDGASPAVRELSQSGMPFVFVDRKAKGIEADAVLSDNFRGAYLATNHLIERGHERIGVVLGIPGATTTEERYAGYRAALEEAGIEEDRELVVFGEYRASGGYRCTRELLARRRPPTAIFSTNNLMTLGVLKALFAAGIRIPRGMAVIGFDDLEWAEMAQPPLTVVTQRPYEIGNRAVKLLLERLGGRRDEPREIRVPVDLIVRGST
ncbi:LacI family transcriptional regulator [Candidatus Acetothermia bacterium]|nr:MAG: LacI family transcriptional regulator [Candidatus Acetothermia bacterium]RLE33147.1 MAG: LacI family transcriptional regulator [Candidatus Acetothermia bacterium]HDC92269.1 LacI family transcriptional regulator [Candidatus Acetothermia bacterium]